MDAANEFIGLISLINSYWLLLFFHFSMTTFLQLGVCAINRDGPVSGIQSRSGTLCMRAIKEIPLKLFYYQTFGIIYIHDMNIKKIL